jgi:hypothetical protein
MERFAQKFLISLTRHVFWEIEHIQWIEVLVGKMEDVSRKFLLSLNKIANLYIRDAVAYRYICDVLKHQSDLRLITEKYKKKKVTAKQNAQVKRARVPNQSRQNYSACNNTLLNYKISQKIKL